MIVFHIPHSSSFIPDEERENIVISDESLASEVLRMTDWYTAELFLSCTEACEVVIYPVSRLVIDPERFEDDAAEMMASCGMGVIYTKTSEGETLRTAPNADVRKKMLERYYFPHHALLTAAVRSTLEKAGKALVIDCHSFPSSPLPYEFDQRKDRPDICLGTDPFHTPEWLLQFARNIFVKQGFSVETDRPFKGTLIPVDYFRKEAAVSGMMIELNRRFYIDERTGTRLSGFNDFKSTLCDVTSELLRHYRSSTAKG